MEGENDDSKSKKRLKQREEREPFVIKKTCQYIKLKLDKLMENPDKPVIIPDPPKHKEMPPPAEFNRNVMGSSAGAGSGEFHVYRHIRRREYARMKHMSAKTAQEQKDLEYQQKLEDNRRKFEERTAKKRAKRLKKKARLNQKLKEKGKAKPAEKKVPEPDENEPDDSEGDSGLSNSPSDNDEASNSSLSNEVKLPEPNPDSDSHESKGATCEMKEAEIPEPDTTGRNYRQRTGDASSDED